MKFKRIEAGLYQIEFAGAHVGLVFHGNRGDLIDGKRVKGWVAALHKDMTVLRYTTNHPTLDDAKAALLEYARQTSHEVTNIMSGKKTYEPITTPFSCSVSSETYWCS